MAGLMDALMIAWSEDPVLFSALLILATFVPPVLFLVWVRNTERYDPEPWSPLFKAFGWGALGGTVLALLLEIILGTPPHAVRQLGISAIVFTSVVVAPLVEEFTKALGFRWIEDDHLELEDGLIYGASIGLGFAAMENLVYGVAAYLKGSVTDVVVTVIIRTFSTTFLHAVATAIIGYAVWRNREGSGDAGGIVTAYLLAASLHAMFNLGASVEPAGAFLGSALLAILGFWWMRKKVTSLDRDTQPDPDTGPP